MDFGTSFLPTSGWSFNNASISGGKLTVGAGGSASVTISEIENANILPEAIKVQLTAENYTNKYSPTSFARLFILYEDDNTYDAIMPIVNIDNKFMSILWPSISNYDIDLSAFTSLTFSVFSSTGIVLTSWSAAKSLNDKLITDKFYYGIKISTETGFEVIASDNTSRAFFNSDTMKFQSGDGSGSNWKDRLYYEYDEEEDETYLVFDGKLSADIITAISAIITPNLYTEKATIAELTVDQLDTSNKIRNYLTGNTSDINYQKIYDQYHLFITASTDGSSYHQAQNRNGALLYWVDDDYEVATTEETDYPVYEYDYTELTKLALKFDNRNGVYTPIIALGAGIAEGSDNGKAFIYKAEEGLYIDYYKRSDGTLLRFALTDDAIDLSDFASLILNDNVSVAGMPQIWVQPGQPNGKDKDVWIDTDDYSRYDKMNVNTSISLDISDPEIIVANGTLSLFLYGLPYDGSGHIKKIYNIGTNVVTLSGPLNGKSEFLLFPGESVELVSVEGSWRIL